MATEKPRDLIDRNQLFNHLADYWGIPRDWDGGVDKTCEDALGAIEDAPTVDAVEVVHAEWLDGSGISRDGSIAYESIDCSHCEEVFKIETHDREYWKTRFKACPFCGALMDGGNEDGC